jgi:esterase superfamily
MALIDLKFYSEVLKMGTEVHVIIPQKNAIGEIGVTQNVLSGNYPCLYLLHGLGGDYSSWIRRTSIERYAEKYGICVVMPSALRSFYTDMKNGLPYYTYVSQELPALIRSFFNISTECKDTFIAGLSMGGYGALKIGLRNPLLYGKIAGISSVCDMPSRALGDDNGSLLKPIFGEELIVPDEDNLFQIAMAHQSDAIKPKVFMGVGTEDMLYEENVRFQAALKENGYDITYKESVGTHSWEFWDEYIQYVLAWMFD